MSLADVQRSTRTESARGEFSSREIEADSVPEFFETPEEFGKGVMVCE